MTGNRYILDEALQKAMEPVALTSLANTAIELSRIFVQQAFQLDSYDTYPDLAILSSDNSDEMKRILLRLLSPGIAFSSDTIDSHNRNQMAADFLLAEVTCLANNDNITLGKITAMEEIASCLMKRNYSLLPDPVSLK
eukprot:CAMPEP_0176492098 /NCGR_PEP_ID=MMETSP0200_2-20121128/8791_1 /TAXON_ID=947934 /ORGANISM="Chaetoceros sp., Strain GSL56" /LENGTH=137 /DNA_ID=CAMNT_0017889585 /DNA_START=339 /DNA_END=749 /DNA_ORIENTATION=+